MDMIKIILDSQGEVKSKLESIVLNQKDRTSSI